MQFNADILRSEWVLSSRNEPHKTNNLQCSLVNFGFGMTRTAYTIFDSSIDWNVCITNNNCSRTCHYNSTLLLSFLEEKLYEINGWSILPDLHLAEVQFPKYVTCECSTELTISSLN
jgi:hypothetical protein